MKYYERDYQKLQDFISNIGGFAKFISFVASVIVKIFNEYTILKDTKSLISLLYNNDKKLMKNQNGELSNIIKDNNKETNNSFSKFNEANLDNSNIKHLDNMIGEENIKADDIKPKDKNNEENIADNMKKYNCELNVEINENENDTESVFNDKNKEFHFCSFLIHKLTFHKKLSNFRKKIISEEQLIKNHIITFNLINATNLNKQIYSLKEMINND